MTFKIEETPSTEVPPQPPEIIPKPKSPWPRIAAVAIIIVIVLGALFTLWWFSRPPPIPWLFKGAYGAYEGSTTVDSTTIQATIRFEVVEFNATHVKLLQYIMMTSPISEPYENQTTTWYDMVGESYDIPGATLSSKNEDYIYFEGFGTRYCTVVKYACQDVNFTFDMTMYEDKETDWPLRIRYDYTQPFVISLDLKLVETNIPGLEK